MTLVIAYKTNNHVYHGVNDDIDIMLNRTLYVNISVPKSLNVDISQLFPLVYISVKKGAQMTHNKAKFERVKSQ